MSVAEREPLLPRNPSTSQGSALSRSGRRSELRDNTGLAHHTHSDQSRLPAAPVDASHSDILHDPRWASNDDSINKANYLAQFRYIWREELAECLGTAMIILFGASVECQTALHYDSHSGRAYSFGDYNSCRFAWAAGVACAVFVSGGISGGHCNPSESFIPS